MIILTPFFTKELGKINSPIQKRNWKNKITGKQSNSAKFFLVNLMPESWPDMGSKGLYWSMWTKSDENEFILLLILTPESFKMGFFGQTAVSKVGAIVNCISNLHVKATATLLMQKAQKIYLDSNRQ